MQIAFLVNQVFSGWEPDDIRLGGTEESIVRWAEELAKRNHKVSVYRNGRNDNHIFKRRENGVWYYPREEYKGADVTINVKSSEIAPTGPTLYLTNETNASSLDLSAYDGVIWPSHYAADHMEVNNPNIFILPHGYDSEKIYMDRKVPKQCFYASSPDRGLDFLLAIWPQVYIRHPDATLIITYGAHVSLPGVINLGECDEETMNEVYRTSDLWLHPCSGGELYCMTGKKAQVAGCIPVIIPRMALEETVRSGYHAKNESEYLSLLLIVLDKPEEDRDLLRDDVMARADAVDWSQSTDMLEGIIRLIYNKAHIVQNETSN
jgi:hypothetical protein